MSRMRRMIPAAAGGLGLVVRVVLQAGPGVLGLLSVAYGAWLAWPPAGFLLFGGLVLADVVWSRRPVRPARVPVAEPRPADLRVAA